MGKIVMVLLVEEILYQLICIKNIRSRKKIGDSGYQLGPWCLPSAASQKILHSNAQYKLSKHMVLHVSPCHDWAKWIHLCVQQHKYNFGIAERSRAAGHVNFANCTLAYYCKYYSKGPNMPKHHYTPFNMLPQCLMHHLHCPSMPLQTKTTQQHTAGACHCNRGTLQLSGHVGGHQGHQAAAQGVHLQPWMIYSSVGKESS